MLSVVPIPRSAAEISNGITPVDYYYSVGDVRRYGRNASPGTTDMTAALQATLTVGKVAEWQQERYRISSTLTWNQQEGVLHSNSANIETTDDIVGMTIGQMTTGSILQRPTITGQLFLRRTAAGSTKQGLILQRVRAGHINISLEGWQTGLELTTDTGDTIHNKIWLSRMLNNEYGVLLNPQGGGVHENTFYGGEFIASSGRSDQWHVYIAEGTQPPTNNKFFGPAFSHGSNIEGYYYDAGSYNAIYQARGGAAAGTMAQNWYVIAQTAVGSKILFPYNFHSGRLTNSGYATVVIAGEGIFILGQHSSTGVAEPMLNLVRDRINSADRPLANLRDMLASSGSSQVLALDASRQGFFWRGRRYFSLVQAADGFEYACISSHTSGASTEPGVGASWTTVWERLPTQNATSTNWATSTFYTGAADLSGASTDGLMYSNRYRLVYPGIPEPALESEGAIIYVDLADGDLKVKFGNGTIATLAAD